MVSKSNYDIIGAMFWQKNKLLVKYYNCMGVSALLQICEIMCNKAHSWKNVGKQSKCSIILFDLQGHLTNSFLQTLA